MLTVQQALALALHHHQAGRLAEAEGLYRQVLAVHPDQPDALHLLGTIAFQIGRHDLAIDWIRRAIHFDPKFADAHYNLGNALRVQGRLDEAIAAYRRAIELQPDFADALHNLGVACKDRGHLEEAVMAFRRALACKPDFAEAYNNLGLALASRHQLEEAIAAFYHALDLKPDFAVAHNNLGVALADRGQFEKAIAAYRRALELQPDFAEALSNLGNALKERGQLDDAIAAYRRALAVKPDFTEAHNNLGIAFMGRGHLEEAVAAYRRALALKPGYAEAHNNLGNALRDQGQPAEAISAYCRALEFKPEFAEAHNNLGNSLKGLGRLEEAVAAYRRAIELKPTYAEAHNNLGVTLRNRGQLEEAIAAFRRALELKPDYAEPHNNLGIACKDQGLVEEAIAAYHRALELKPDYAEAHNNLGVALKDRGQLDEAIAAYQRALELKPAYAPAHNNLGAVLKDRGELGAALAAFRQSLQLGPEQALVHSNLVFTLHFDPESDDKAIAEEQQRWNRQFSDTVKRSIAPHANDRDPERRLRVGYVSPDLRDHVVGRNLLPLFQHHDRRNLEILCYAGVVMPDKLTEAIRKEIPEWRSTLGVADDALAETIRHDRVDILVDLSQHLGENRLPVFARKPAPVQVSFAGYPESTGLEAIEYRVSDKYLESGMGDDGGVVEAAVPAAFSSAPGGRGGGARDKWRQEFGRAAHSRLYSRQSNLHAEHIFLLDSFWCYDPCGTEVAFNALPAHENERVTFGSLNNFCKVNDPLLRLWARVLGEVKDSRLIILSGFGSHRQRTLEFLEREGVAAQRVEFVELRPRQAYLELYHRLDIVLDTFPYNGHTTSLDALWMGVPVVSLAGERAISRAGLSQLSNLGLPELVAHSEDEYLQIAARLAGDLPRLAELRRALRSRMEASVLMDAPRFARGIETAYRAMWRRWCAEEANP